MPVRRLQSRMSAVGFNTGGVDGRFGPTTEAAVKTLQSNLTADGVVDSQTWQVVDALENEGGASYPGSLTRSVAGCRRIVTGSNQTGSRGLRPQRRRAPSRSARA